MVSVSKSRNARRRARGRGKTRARARLYGAGEALREELGASVLPVYLGDYQRGVSVLETNLARERLRALWNEGLLLSLEDALELGLSS